MKLNAKFLKDLPEETITLVCGLAIGVFTAPVTFGCAICAWAVGLGFLSIAQNHPIRRVPITTHFNLVCLGLILGLNSSWSWAFALAILVGSVGTCVAATMIGRLFYYYWIPVMMSPALVVSMMLLRFNNLFGHIAPGINSNIAMTITPLSVVPLMSAYTVSSLALGVLSPLILLLLGIGLTVSCSAIFLLNGFVSPGDFDILTAIIGSILFASTSTVATIPSLKTILWSFFAIGLFMLSTHVLRAPNVTTLLCVEVLFLANGSGILAVYGSRVFFRRSGFSSSYEFRPERKIEDIMTQWSRFRVGEARTGLPFEGEWTVSQSFDGSWTHKGTWRHGLDFVKTDAGGSTFSNEGFELSDYYAFDQEVQAPVSGYVVSMVDNIADNPIGIVNTTHNFGNHVLIRDIFGAYSLIAHLKQKSITCKLYQYVEAGTAIGKCGNSGYSPEPHIHLHVQADPIVTSPTIPFHLTHYLCSGRYHFHGVPPQEAVIAKPKLNQTLARQLNFEIGERMVIGGSNQVSIEIENCLDPVTGMMYFTDGQAKLFHFQDRFSFYFYRFEGTKSGPLFDLMTSLPRLPLIFGGDCEYEDHPPVIAWSSQSQRWAAYLRQIFISKFLMPKSTFVLNNGKLEVISSHVAPFKMHTSCKLDPMDGFVEYKVGDRQYEVKDRRKSSSVVSSHYDRAISVSPRSTESEIRRAAI